MFIVLAVWWSNSELICYSFLRSSTVITANTDHVKAQLMIVMHKMLFVEQPILVNRKGPILLHDNARPHVSQFTIRKIHELGYETLKHPTYKEATLPTLPVPDLESTLQKYLAQVEAVAPHHLPKTRSLVKAFLSGPGPKLQQRLVERRQKMTNWVSE
ncbi:Histone-lysine N-methyltransferase SETMAR [Habropoda laboriosa]|uniref:Histone-lysine N-methyltransferase SETMAR n=1 Tax=Habropoda laboriosa TaxID=597456 RepID=A0A0L7RJP1_9HYME|nr:Histone-lysine N-methyltransferase SETMAR [Habropoda laboriosa]